MNAWFEPYYDFKNSPSQRVQFKRHMMILCGIGNKLEYFESLRTKKYYSYTEELEFYSQLIPPLRQEMIYHESKSEKKKLSILKKSVNLWKKFIMDECNEWSKEVRYKSSKRQLL